MPITRIELADAGSPEKLVTLILKHEPQLAIPVPIEALARQLDITDICELTTEGFEGGLITDRDRHSGIILYRRGSFLPRRRYTVGHELAHFLLPHHIPDQEGQFLCTRADFARMSAKEQDRRGRMEVEANRFASLILMPPPFLRRAIANGRDPSFAELIELAKDFAVSKQAMARAYADYHPLPVAVLIIEDTVIKGCYRDRRRFPFVKPKHGQTVPNGSLFYKSRREPGAISDVRRCLPDIWIDVEWGKKSPELYEQILGQQNGFSMIMLHTTQPDEDEEDEERLIERNWQVGFPR